MFCPKCGHRNPDEAKFCGRCGESTVAPVAAPLGADPSGKAGESGAVSTGMKVGISIATVVIPLIGIVMGILYLRDANPQKKSAGRLWLWIGIGMIVFYLAVSTDN